MTDTGLPHLPGVATVSQILSALEAEYTELKFFPTQAAGGANSSSRSDRHASGRPAEPRLLPSWRLVHLKIARDAPRLLGFAI